MLNKSAVVSTLPTQIYLRAKWLESRVRDPHGHARRQRMRQIKSRDGYSYEVFDRTHSIFVHVPKCAGKSICRALYGNLAGGHTTLNEYSRSFEPRAFERYFKFAFVRNPWDRLVSAYHFLKMAGMYETDPAFADSELASYTDFKEFVRGWVNEVNVGKYHLFRPQFYYLRDLHSKVQLDFIGRFENIENDFRHVTNKLGLTKSLSQSNSSVHPEYRSLYSDDTREVVARVYARDIQELHYEF